MAWRSEDMVRIVRALNGELKRHGANHDLYTVPGADRPVSIPRHRGDLPTGTANSILRQLGLTPERARKLL
jgi:hypothetical protein